MGKKHLLPNENEEFLDRLGLTEIDKKVYIAALDGGLVSAGEIQQLTEIKDLGHILESVRDLIDIGLVKKAQGMMPRYYATLPFFRETLSVEREFKFALEAMLQSLNQAKENTTKNREMIVAARFPKIVDSLLDQYYKEILAPIISELENLRDEVKSNLLGYIKEIDAEGENIKEEISLMLKPLIDYSKLLNQKFELGIANEQGELNQYITQRKQNRLQSLQKAHGSIGTNLEGLNHQIDNLGQELISLRKALQEQVDQLGMKSTQFGEEVNKFKEASPKINDAKKELQAELVVAREQIKKVVQSEGMNKDEKVDEIFANLTGKIKSIHFNSDDITGNLETALSTMKSSYTGLDDTLNGLDQTVTAITDRLHTYFTQLKTNMTESFNDLNENDEDSLQTLKEAIGRKLQELDRNIQEEGKTVLNRLEEHIQSIESQQEESLSRWQEKMSSLYTRPAETITPFLDQWLDDIEPIINQFKQKSDEALIDILEPIQKLETETFSTLTERIGFVKAMIEGRSNDLQQVLDFAKNFDFTKTSDTWVVVGLPAIYASLTDLLLRTKTKVTVVTPHLDLELIEVARTMKSTIRISFVSDIDPDKDARLIKKLDEIGRINLRSYPDRDLYACIRDSEEIIFGYIRDGEETVGIRTSTPSIVKLLEDRFNETVIRNSRPV